jgi:crotonobetainyl-CoA:carnitine CoA-transferase CaiB-like acyl-CoA transferase
MLPVMTGTPGRTKWAGPDLGHHTEEVLREQLKLDDAAIVKLQQQKVI